MIWQVLIIPTRYKNCKLLFYFYFKITRATYIEFTSIYGGVEFYSENIIRGIDVICSVYNRTDLFLYRVFSSVFSYRGKPELITRHVEVSHNIVINAKQNIKPVLGVFNVNEISC